MKKIFACLLTVCLCSAGFAAPASAAASEKAAVTIADGVNVTRWDNFLVVYKDIAATGQNEWGHNIVAVSYTHLDVYKRQTVGCAASSYDCPSAAVWEAARIFAGAKI